MKLGDKISALSVVAHGLAGMRQLLSPASCFLACVFGASRVDSGRFATWLQCLQPPF